MTDDEMKCCVDSRDVRCCVDNLRAVADRFDELSKDDECIGRGVAWFFRGKSEAFRAAADIVQGSLLQKGDDE